MLSSAHKSPTSPPETVYAVIFANGDPPDAEAARWHADRADLLLAADGGTHHALALGIVPHLVIGDMDSLSEDHQRQLRAAGTRFIVHPDAKDETDLELALLYAVEQNADPIIVLAALGGRIDQTIANILLFTLPVLCGRDVRLIDGSQTALVVRDETTIVGKPGDTVSLIPLGGAAVGVTTTGLAYPLAGGTLPFGPGLGVSNEMTATHANVQVREGLLLCVHLSRQEITTRDRSERVDGGVRCEL